MKVHKDLEHRSQIRPEERDYQMEMQLEAWGQKLRGWKPEREPALHYVRKVLVHQEHGRDATQLEETIVPFPSAPIYGINRKAEYGEPLERRPNMHSVRLLKRPDSAPIHRLFVLHNGLNEVDSLKFYYRLADWIMSQQEAMSEGNEGVACLIMPFPGHLMHAPFHGPFSETPLSRYLTDSGDLFRQFLRYMTGMRWLLSIVADSDAANWMVGGSLLDPNSRAKELLQEFDQLYDASSSRMKRTARLAPKGDDGPEERIPSIGESVSKPQIDACHSLLRSLLGRSAGNPSSLRVHVVGYSLGGFIAQSVFFAWPQVVSSCTTICSGGAISALSPTAFAQPEEWQSVLHALRPETMNSMLQGRIGDDERLAEEAERPVEKVAGMPLDRYGYFQRIFEHVFLQEDSSSYKERLSEYSLRMFFVSGGEDPIVPPANILDASPREGTTMLSVAGMTHFLNQDPKDDGDRREAEQRDFWLPEAGGMIARAAVHAEKVHMDERAEAARLKAKRKRPPTSFQLSDTNSSSLLSDGYQFEAALDWVLKAVTPDQGWLVICRNSLPAAFLPSEHFTTWGTGLHHHDLRIQRYALGLRHRAAMLKKVKDRTTLVVPEQLRHWFVDLSARFEPQSDAPRGRFTTKSERDYIWREFVTKWTSTIRYFDAGDLGEAIGEGLVDSSFASGIAQWIEADESYLRATHLPDVWIGIEDESRLLSTQVRNQERMREAFLEGVENVLADLVKLQDAESSRGKVVTPFKKKLEDDLERGHIRVLQISDAEFNPRYRGRIERNAKSVARLMACAAAGLSRSRPLTASDLPRRRSPNAKSQAAS